MSFFTVEVARMRFTETAHIVRSAPLRRFLGRFLKIAPMTDHATLIEGFELSVNRGEFVSLVGPSGAGKTTLLRIMAGLVSEYEGGVSLDGIRVASPSRRIQVVFQDSKIIPWLNVRNNIRFAARQNGTGGAEAKVDSWVHAVGLSRRTKAFPKHLSGGEESRVAIARVFVEPPDVLLLDEPFRALDTVTKAEVQDRLEEAIIKNSTSVVMVSHSIGDAVHMSNRVVLLNRGPLTVREIVNVPGERPRARGGNATPSLVSDIEKRLLVGTSSDR